MWFFGERTLNVQFCKLTTCLPRYIHYTNIILLHFPVDVNLSDKTKRTKIAKAWFLFVYILNILEIYLVGYLTMHKAGVTQNITSHLSIATCHAWHEERPIHFQYAGYIGFSPHVSCHAWTEERTCSFFVTHDSWHMTHDTWHVKNDILCNISQMGLKWDMGGGLLLPSNLGQDGVRRERDRET
jgi:hypothetical protein